MEVAIYGVVTTITWLMSSSIFLPFLLLLRFNKTIRDKWFSFIFAKCCGSSFTRKLIPCRKRTFKLLEDHLTDRDKLKPLQILEIGIGSGANLEFYPENSTLTALDMNASFGKYFQETQKKHPQVSYERTVICMAENMPDVADSSMDIVVCTYVMCSVIDIDSVLKEVKRVLKPGGKFLFLEHVAFQTSEWSYTIQRAISPLWRIYFDGCCPDRDIKTPIYKAGFSSVSSETVLYPSLFLFVRPQMIGIATK